MNILHHAFACVSCDFTTGYKCVFKKMFVPALFWTAAMVSSLFLQILFPSLSPLPPLPPTLASGCIPKPTLNVKVIDQNEYDAFGGAGGIGCVLQRQKSNKQTCP